MRTGIAIAAAMALLAGCATMRMSRTTECLNNMRLISGAMEVRAEEMKLENGAQIPRDKVAEYVKGGLESHPCREGGTYTFGTVGVLPKCSFHGTYQELLDSVRGEK